MKYTSERKDKADRQMTKATRRFKQNIAKNKGDYGNVPAAYAAAPHGATYDHEMLSGSGGLNEMDQLLFALLEEAKQQIPNLKCAVCGGEHHPAAKHTARALAPENNIQEGSMPLHKAKRSLEAKGFKHTGTKGQVHSYAHSDGRKAQIQQSTVHDCPKCGSDRHLSFSDYDFGHDSQTGYHDAGGRFHCKKCGTKGDAEDAQNHRGKIVSEGLGPVVNGKQKPITPYAGSWADQEAKRKAANPGKVHPLAKDMYPGATKLPGKYDRHGNKIAEGEKPTPDEMLKATLCKKTPNGKEVLDELGEKENGGISKSHASYKAGHHFGTIKNLGSKPSTTISMAAVTHADDLRTKYQATRKKGDGTRRPDTMKALDHFHAGASDAARERGLIEGKKNKGPKWDGNSLTIKSGPEDIRRKAAAVIGQPPPKQVIKSKKDKGEKYKKNWRDMDEASASARPPSDPADTPAMFQAANDAIVGTQDKVVGVKEVEGFPQSSNLKAIKRRNAGNSIWAKIKKGSAF